MITPIYAAILTLLLVILIVRIVRLRWKLSIAIGDGGDRVVMRAIRAHGNFIETAPWGIMLLLLLEMTNLAPMGLHIFGGTLVLGRALHAWGLSRHAGPTIGRMGGMILTILLFVAGGILCLVQTL